MSRVGRKSRALVASGLSHILAFGAIFFGCVARPRCDGIACAPACPRDAARDPSGRCACTRGQVLLLGACVPPSVADAYCGPAARAGVDGCVFHVCTDNELLDSATGDCLPKTTLRGEATSTCGDGGAPVLVLGRMACVDADAVCPRGTLRSGPVCPGPPRCPPGSLAMGGTCRPVVSLGVRSDTSRVDVGAWAELVLGTDGGPGSPYLCRPLALRPDAFGLTAGNSATVTLRIALATPDQDLSRTYARVQSDLNRSEAQGPSPSSPISGAGEALVADSVKTLIEPLRGLGGEASSAMVDLTVTCRVRSL